MMSRANVNYAVTTPAPVTTATAQSFANGATNARIAVMIAIAYRISVISATNPKVFATAPAPAAIARNAA